MEARIALKYSGPAVESGLMDVYEASANMIALSEFVVIAAKAAFGPSAEARASVAGFARGSFVTDMVINVAPISATIFSAFSSEQLWSAAKGAIDLWKHLKGSPPSKVENNKQSISVTNNDGQILQIQAESLHIVMSDKGSAAVEQFVKKAMEKSGMDEVSISTERGEIAHISQQEAVFFGSVVPSQQITDATIKMGLIIEAPVFKEGNKWRFSDGQQSFYAAIEDLDFLSRVDAGERFGKGDILQADVRIQQAIAGDRISAERSLVKVHFHKIASMQLPLS